MKNPPGEKKLFTINEVFDIEATEPIGMEVGPVIIPDADEDGSTVDVDFNAARDNYYEIMEQGKAAIETAMLVAKETQNPRAIEVLSVLLKNMADINKQLILLSKDKEDVKVTRRGSTPGAAPHVNNQTNNFIGTSADLNKLLAEQLAKVKG